MNNLPQAQTSLVGRDADVASVTAALNEGRCLTVTGSPGVGKTRLALRVAADLVSEYEDGAWLCELAPISDGAAVAPALAAVLSVDRTAMEATDTVVEALRTRQTLLLLDNCEHLVGAVAPLVEAVLRRCPDVRVLATSRERLRFSGERVWPLHPLDTPGAGVMNPDAAARSPALALFVARARSVRPDFRLTADNVAAVVEICRRLEGLPLAIELAAARTASMSPADIATRLDAPLRLLTGGPRTADPRQRSLRGAVQWSYALLTEPERILFARLSTFAGGATLEALEAVCADSVVATDGVVEVVHSLVDKSLVTAEDTSDSVRYTMLETLRDYASERLADTDEVDALHARHARYCAGLVEMAGRGLRGPEVVAWLHRLDAEMGNLRVVHTRALATGDIRIACAIVAPLYEYAAWHSRPEVFAWATAATTEGASADPGFPGACAIAGWGALTRGDLTGARDLAERALLAERELGEGPNFVLRLLHANVTNFAGDVDGALAEYQDCIATAREVGDAYNLAKSLARYVLALSEKPAGLRSRALAEEALRVARATGNPTLIAWATYAMGEALMAYDAERALAILEEAAVIAQSVDAQFIVGIALLSATSLRGRLDGPEEALPGYLDLIARWRRAGNWAQQWVLLRNLAELLSRLGSRIAAATLLGAIEASGTPSPVRGPQAERLAQVAAGLERHLGFAGVAEAMGRGRSMSRTGAVDIALEEIERLMATSAPPPDRIMTAAPHSPDAGSMSGVFRREGELWVLTYQGATARVRDAKGMHDLARLLANPGAEIPALDLVAGIAAPTVLARVEGIRVAAPADTGELLDARARAEYRSRIEELEADIAAAERDNDPVRLEGARRERDQLVTVLAAAYGLGGRPRRGGDPAQRARWTVTWRLRDSIARIGRAHPALGRHLRNSVRTGIFCGYLPETPINWEM